MNKLKIEIQLGEAVFVLIALAALLLRFINLGLVPLTPDESMAALRAMHGTLSESAFAEPLNLQSLAPGYELPTRLLFNLFNPSDATARVVPALAGFALCLTPLLARNKLGWGRVLFLSSFLAFSPITVTVSRTAGGLGLAALGVMIVCMQWISSGLEVLSQPGRWWIIAGLTLILLSGVDAMMGLLALLMLAPLIWLRKMDQSTRLRTWLSDQVKILWIAPLLAVALGAGLGIWLEGAGGIFTGIAGWFNGWTQQGHYNVLALLMSLVVYMPAGLIFGLLGLLWAYRSDQAIDQGAGLMAVGTLLLVMLYPARNTMMLILPFLGFAALASGYLVHVVELPRIPRNWAWVGTLVFVLLVLAVFIFLQLSALDGAVETDRTIHERLALAAFTLAAVVIILFVVGWDWPSALDGARIALFLCTTALGLSAMWQANYTILASTGREMIRHAVTKPGMRYLVESVEEVSMQAAGTPHGLPLQIQGSPSPALVWALRNAESGNETAAGAEPAPMILVPQKGEAVDFGADYIGQPLAVVEEWGWSPLPLDLITYWTKHKAPVTMETWVLYVRTDIAAFQVDAP